MVGVHISHFGYSWSRLSLHRVELPCPWDFPWNIFECWRYFLFIQTILIWKIFEFIDFFVFVTCDRKTAGTYRSYRWTTRENIILNPFIIPLPKPEKYMLTNRAVDEHMFRIALLEIPLSVLWMSTPSSTIGFCIRDKRPIRVGNLSLSGLNSDIISSMHFSWGSLLIIGIQLFAILSPKWPTKTRNIVRELNSSPIWGPFKLANVTLKESPFRACDVPKNRRLISVVKLSSIKDGWSHMKSSEQISDESILISTVSDSSFWYLMLGIIVESSLRPCPCVRQHRSKYRVWMFGICVKSWFKM